MLDDVDLDVRLRADVDTVLTQLAAVNREAEKLDGQTVTLKIDTDRRSLADSIVQVAALGRALTTLAAPASLAAAAPQIASIGAAALDAVGAVALLPAVGFAAGTAMATLNVGMAGFSEALANRGDAEAFAEAIADLSPNARSAAVTVRDLGKAWTDVRLDVQDRLFRNVGQSIQRLSDRYLPVLRRTMGGIADGFNEAGTSSARFLSSEPTVRRLSSAFDRVRESVRNSSGALQPLTEGFVTLVTVGATRLPQLGQNVANVSDRFRDWLAEAERTGELAGWIDAGVDSLRQLGRIAGDVGGSLVDLFSIADAEGASFLDTVERVTSGVREFLRSADGQETIASVFRTIRETSDAATPGVQALGRAVLDVVNRLADSGTLQNAGAAFSAIAVQVAPLLSTLGTLATTVLPPLLSLLGQLAPVLVPAAAGLLAASAAAKGLDVLGTQTGRVREFFGSMREADGASGKFRTAVGGLAGFLGVGGPWGLAIGAAVTVTTLLVGAWADGEQAAAEQKARIDELRGSLETYSGAATDATRAQVAQELGTRKLADGTTSYAAALSRAGVDTRDFVDATTGNEQALQKVRTQLDSYTRTLIESSPAYQQNTHLLRIMGIGLEDLTAAAQGNQPAMDRINQAVLRAAQESPEAAAGFDQIRAALMEAGGAGAELGGELNRMAHDYGVAAQQARDAGQANLVFADVLTVVRQGLRAIGDGLPQTQLMRQGLTDLGTAAEQAAQQAASSAAEWGGVAEGGRAAADSMAQSRQAFVDAATAADMTADEANRLADQVGLIPAAARIIFETNATGTAAELTTLKSQFDAVPDQKTIAVQALSDEAKARLIDLGFRVETLPDGTFRVHADTEQAKANLQAIVADANAAVGVMTLDARPDPATGKISATVQFANGSTGVMTLDANGAPAELKIGNTKYRVDTTTGVMTIDGNPAPGEADLSGLKVAVDRTTGTLTILGRDGGVAVLKADLSRPSQSTHTIYVRTVGRMAVNPRGGPQEYAGGGVVGRPLRAARGLVVPGYRPGVDDVPAVLSRGEAVLVPELVRQLGASRILRANAEASGGRAPTVVGRIAGMMDGLIDRRRGSASAGATRTTGGTSVSGLTSTPRWSASSGDGLRPLLAQVLTAVGAMARAGGGPTFQNTFMIPDAARTSDEVARVQRTQAALGLFGAPAVAGA